MPANLSPNNSPSNLSPSNLYDVFTDSGPGTLETRILETLSRDNWELRGSEDVDLWRLVVETDRICTEAMIVQLSIPALSISENLRKVFPAFERHDTVCNSIYHDVIASCIPVRASDLNMGDALLWIVPMYAFQWLMDQLGGFREDMVRVRKAFEHQVNYAGLFISRWRDQLRSNIGPTSSTADYMEMTGNLPPLPHLAWGADGKTVIEIGSDKYKVQSIVDDMRFEWTVDEIPEGQTIVVRTDDFDRLFPAKIEQTIQHTRPVKRRTK